MLADVKGIELKVERDVNVTFNVKDCCNHCCYFCCPCFFEKNKKLEGDPKIEDSRGNEDDRMDNAGHSKPIQTQPLKKTHETKSVQPPSGGDQKSVPRSQLQVQVQTVQQMDVQVRVVVSNDLGAQWPKLGQGLGIQHADLEIIRLNYEKEGVFEVAMQVLLFWLRNNPNATLDLLIDVLEKPPVENRRLVRKIQNLPDPVPTDGSERGVALDEHEDVIGKVADQLARHWKNLGRSLGIPENKLDDIAQNNNETSVMAKKVLMAWMNKSKYPTVSILKRHLVAIGRKDIAEDI